MRKFLGNLFGSKFLQIMLGISAPAFAGGWAISNLEGVDEITQGVNPFWWAIVTMTTVGYGDFAPKTSSGRLIAILIMYGGILLTALLTATISSIFVARRIREDKGLGKLNVTGHVLLCGWNKSVDRILDSLQSLRGDRKMSVVLINDEHEDKIAAVKGKYQDIDFMFVRGDHTRESVLERANVAEAAKAVVIPADLPEGRGQPDEKTILGTLTIKAMAPNVKVVAYINERGNLTHINRANADDVILSDDFAAYMAASHVMEPGVPQTVEALLDSGSHSRFHRVEIPSEFVGKSYGELLKHFRKKHGWILVSTFSEEEQIGIGEILASDSSALDAFIERKLKAAGHTLLEESKTSVVVNPGPDYTINKHEKAIVVL